VRHPESNGLVEIANGIIITGIMKSIFNQPKGKWPDELIKVVWNHNIVVSRSTGFTPFKLLFDDEAITPEEARTGSIRTLASTQDINKYQAETIKWRERKVRLKNIKPGHLVLRRVANPDTVGKLQFKWQGPFLVVSSSRPGFYRLKDMDSNDIPRSWNADECWGRSASEGPQKHNFTMFLSIIHEQVSLDSDQNYNMKKHKEHEGWRRAEAMCRRASA
jgi:hypothetical protein